MKIIPKQIWKENYLCSSNRTVDDLKSAIEKVFQSPQGRKISVTLSGSFYAPYAFLAHSRWRLVTAPGFSENWVAYLSGEILQRDGKTFVRFTVRPHITLTILFFAPPIITLLIFIVTRRIQTDPNGLLAEGIMLVGLPLIILMTCIISKRMIRKRFVNTFELQEITSA